VTSVESYEVYAIRYATIARKPGENFILGDPHEKASNLDYFVWLVRSAKRMFVIDTGFNEAAGARRGRHFLTPPAEGLARIGVDVKQVKDVVITHLHYDHVGGFEQFPSARFHLQDDEMRYATGRHMGHGFFSHAYEVDEVIGMVRQVYKCRVVFHDGDAELASGLTLHRIGGHTMGIQCVRVRTRVGWMVLASDAAHLYANMEERRPFPIVYDVGDMIEGWRRLQALADDPSFVVPGHDPLVMKRYSAPSPPLEGLAVRLDAIPEGEAPQTPITLAPVGRCQDGGFSSDQAWSWETSFDTRAGAHEGFQTISSRP
jgi:glyoxylase-like metal-dependent hydrolase (beta-lactamase superfamily II)